MLFFWRELSICVIFHFFSRSKVWIEFSKPFAIFQPASFNNLNHERAYHCLIPTLLVITLVPSICLGDEQFNSFRYFDYLTFWSPQFQDHPQLQIFWLFCRLGVVQILRNHGWSGGLSKWLQYYIGGWGVGVRPNDYNITWGGSLGTQKVIT